MYNLGEFKRHPDRMSDFCRGLPCRPGIVLNKDGSLQRSFSFRGPDLDSATQAELVPHRHGSIMPLNGCPVDGDLL